MANYTDLKAAIQQVIRENGNEEITGTLLQQSLLAMVNSLGAGYLYMGIATPEMNPGTPDQNVFYFALTAGTYTDFGGIVIAEGETAILRWDSTWHKDTIEIDAKPDWDQNDPAADDYIKHRTHYEETATASLEWDTDVADTSRKLYLNLGENRVTLNPYTGLFGLLYWRDVEDNWKWQITVGDTLELWEREGGENVRHEQYDGFSFATTPQPFNLGFEAGTTIHKLDNKFLDMDTEPTTGSGKPITSGGVKAALNNIPAQQQSDWNEDDTSSPAYIKNKPTIPTVPTDVLKYTEQTLTDAQKGQARTNIGAASDSDVSQLRSEVDGKLDAYEIVSELPINATVDGWYLKGDGYTTTNTSYRIRKYQVTYGMSLYLRLSKDSPGVYQFQDQASVPSSGTLHVIGETVTTATDGVVAVPQGATYLIVSLLKTNTSNEVNIVNTYDKKVISEIAISSNSSRLFNNRYIDNNAAIIEDKDWVISPKIKCSQGAVIKWKSGYANTSIYISIVAFNSMGEKIGYYSVGSTQQEYRSFTADWSGTAYVIASFYKGNTGGYLEIDGVRLIEITAQTLLSLDDQPITVLDNDVIANNISKEPSVVSCASLLGTDSYKVAGKLTLLWLSDIHGNATNLSRIVRYGKYHSQLFSDIIHTGDSVLSTISNADPFQSVNGAEKILNVIGNHEAWLSSSDTDYNATEKQTYDKIFAPNIANWDVVQPANAADNGYCYYYKDYTTEKFRLIVLDSVHWHYRNGVAQQNAAQKSWFESVLADAKTQSLTVICATHYTPQNGINPVPNTGFNLLGATAGGNIADGWYASDEMFGCVDDFVINGGKFAGWIVGHTHTDYIGTVFNHNSQPIVIMGTSGTTSRNNKFLAGTSSQDNFDVITFEVLSNKSIVKVVKLGQDTDIYLRSKKTICYDFTDSNLISTT